jgi:hypothetical protein
MQSSISIFINIFEVTKIVYLESIFLFTLIEFIKLEVKVNIAFKELHFVYPEFTEIIFFESSIKRSFLNHLKNINYFKKRK